MLKILRHKRFSIQDGYGYTYVRFYSNNNWDEKSMISLNPRDWHQRLRFVSTSPA